MVIRSVSRLLWIAAVWVLVNAAGGQSQRQTWQYSRVGPVVLDIGHFIGGEGASAPGPVRGVVLKECEFWYCYAEEVKREVERGGYACVVTNRGSAPTEGAAATYARRIPVVQLKRPDAGGRRRPSRYHPDRVGSGIVSADYAIARKAACVVFLHLNSSGSRWVSGASPGCILCNRYNGCELAAELCTVLNTEVLNHGMPNGGRGCRAEVRYVDAERAAAWLNACDDSGIPAAVVEAAFVNNRGHAEYLSQAAGARAFARAIGRGIVNYLRRNEGRRRHVRQNENVPDEGSFGYAAESRRLDVPGAKKLIR